MNPNQLKPYRPGPIAQLIGAPIGGAIGGAAFSVVSNWLGRNWISLAAGPAAGLGAVASLATCVAQQIMNKLGIPPLVSCLTGYGVGVAAAYGASVYAASAGFIAAPLTIKTAAILMVGAIATNCLIGLAIAGTCACGLGAAYFAMQKATA